MWFHRWSFESWKEGLIWWEYRIARLAYCDLYWMALVSENNRVMDWTFGPQNRWHLQTKCEIVITLQN